MAELSPSGWVELIERLLGAPFEWCARGPDAFDCWGVVLEVRRACGAPVLDGWEAFGTDASNRVEAACLMERETAQRGWAKVEVPAPGDIAVMSTHQIAHHVGVVTPFGILNTTEQLGVMVDSPEHLKFLGYKRLEYYRWEG